MSRLVFLLVLAATALSAAVIRGTIVENRTGKPLSRVAVVLQPIAGTPGSQAAVRTNSFGGFEFTPLAGGAYVLKASRLGFLSLEYGQKQWNSAGQPIVLTDDGSAFLNIRLMRYGGIIGTILDENDIGMPDHDVVAYRNTQPPQLAARAKSDDRGLYRISGLEPDVYLVRTAGNQDEGISYVPTFSKEAQHVEGARIVQVLLDEDATGMDVRPAPGKLYSIAGAFDTDPPGMPVTVTLASDMGRKVSEGSVFHFGALPAGPYEICAEAPEIPGVGKFQAAYLQLDVYRDTSLGQTLQAVRETAFDFAPSATGGSSSMQVTARRKDLAGVGPSQILRLTNNRVGLGFGRWEASLLPPSGYYVSGFYGPGFGRGRTRPDGWNEFTAGQGSVRFNLSGGPGEMHGVVKAYSDPVAGAPVFLEAYDPETRKRVTDLRVSRTDMHGVYRFQGLAPGTYRVLSTFEYVAPDSAAMDLAGAQSIKVEARSDPQMDLELWGVR